MNPDAGPVLLEVDDGVATLTLNRPDQLNSLTRAAKTALRDAVERVAEDTSVRALVLTGAGRAFCVGQDLGEHAAVLASGDPQPMQTVVDDYNPVIEALAALPFPTIAALNGTAAGAGLGLACATTFRIGCAGARFTTAFAGIGLSVDSGLSHTLPRLVGRDRALRLLLDAQPFTAEQAHDWGLLTELVAAEEVFTTALTLARRYAQGPTTAYAGILSSVAFAEAHPLSASLAHEAEQQAVAGVTQDHRQAVDAFLGKQKPTFTGR